METDGDCSASPCAKKMFQILQYIDIQLGISEARITQLLSSKNVQGLTKKSYNRDSDGRQVKGLVEA